MLSFCGEMDCFAPLAMTRVRRLGDGLRCVLPVLRTCFIHVQNSGRGMLRYVRGLAQPEGYLMASPPDLATLKLDDFAAHLDAVFEMQISGGVLRRMNWSPRRARRRA